MRITSTAVLNFGETMMDNLRNGKRLAILLAVSGCLFAADPIFLRRQVSDVKPQPDDLTAVNAKAASYKPLFGIGDPDVAQLKGVDRKSTRLNSSHLGISYAVFCLKKKK